MARNGVRRVPGLDGFRGVAVLSVLGYHFWHSALPGGFLGVDIFFVLSGFLITSLLLRERFRSSRIRFGQFWLRRARRILPAAVVTLVVGAAVAGCVGGDVNVQLGRQVAAGLLFASNWSQIAHASSYFAQGELPIFAHFWSLSVEEQFYLVWPLIVAAVLGFSGSSRGNARAVGWLSVVLAAVSAVWMGWLFEPAADATRVYYGTDTHAFGLLLGAAIAAASVSLDGGARVTWGFDRRIFGSPAVLSVASVVAVGALLVFFVVMPDQGVWTYRGGLVAASVCAAVVIVALVRGAGPVVRVFEWGWLRHVGLISFSLYLWHVPVHALVATWFYNHGVAGHEVQVGLVALAVSLCAAEVSYRVVEVPIRRAGYRRWVADVWAGRVSRVAVPAVAAVSVVGAGVAVAQSAPVSQLEQDLGQIAALSEQTTVQAQPTPVPTPTPTPVPVDMASIGPEISAFGDSVMLASAPALQQKFPGIVVDAAVSRQWVQGAQLVRQAKQMGTLRRFVVLGFGTNGPAPRGLVEDLAREIGPEHSVILVAPFGSRGWMGLSQDQLRAAAQQFPNVFIADWCGFAMAHPEALYQDGIHPRPGTWGYADAVWGGLDHAVRGDHGVSGGAMCAR